MDNHTQNHLPANKNKKTELKIGSKIGAVVFLVFGLMIIFSFGALAYQYFLEKIDACAPGETGVCYRVETAHSGKTQKMKLENLDPSKKYEMVVKKEVGGEEVEVSRALVDLKKINDPNQIGSPCLSRQHSMDNANINCCEGLVAKADLWTADTALYTCCQQNECAQDGVCVANNTLFKEWNKKCLNGSWVGDSTGGEGCLDSDGGRNFDQKGEVHWLVQNFKAQDWCRGDALLEYYCEDGMYEQVVEECEFGCSEGRCLREGEVGTSCHEEGVRSEEMVDPSALNCCVGLVKKSDLWNGPTYENYGCCSPSACLQDGVCEPNGSDHTADWGVKCVDGAWEGELKTF